MRFVLMFLYCVGFVMLLVSRTYAIEFKASQAEFSEVVEQIVESRIQPVIQHLPTHEQRILDGVQIQVVERLPYGSMALAIDDERPLILINNQFIRGLSAYVEAYQLALFENQPSLIEQYFSEYFWKYHPSFIGVQPKSPIEWSAASAIKKMQIKQKSVALLEEALIDVLLHELGHHAKDAFYAYRASKYEIDTQEKLADQWANNIRSEWFSSESDLGRLLSIAFIFEQDRWATLMRDDHYRRMLPGVINQLPVLCDNAVIETKRKFCADLYQNITRYFSNQIMLAYEERLEKGEEFASFPIAQIHLAKNNFVDACNYFNESLIYGQVARAAIYVGWCYQKGYLDASPPDAQVLAMSGSTYGFTDRHLEVGILLESDRGKVELN